MAIPISFITLVIRKDALETDYPGGLAAFRAQRQGRLEEDQHLVGVAFMSSGEVQPFLDVLMALGMHLPTSCAIGEMMNGEQFSCEGITFVQVANQMGLPKWQAHFIDQETGHVG
jgi:hypothetical protein